MNPKGPSAAAILGAIDALGPDGTPWTASEIASALDWPPHIHDRLDALVEEGVLDSKTVGHEPRVWWRPPDTRPTDDRAIEGEPPPSALRSEGDATSDSELGVYTLDTEGRLVSLNDRAETLLGTTEADVRGQYIWDAFERDEEADTAFRRARDSGETTHFLTYYEPWGRWFDNWVYPADSGITVYFSEVTRRDEIERALRDVKLRLELALNAANMGTWQCDLADRTLRADPTVTSLFDLPPTDDPIPVERFLERMSPTSVARCEAAMDTEYEAGETVRLELRLDHAGDGPVWTAWRGQAVRDDPSKIVGVGFDVTERKRNERRLARQREQLERQNDRLEEFTESLSHDLRTPLSIIGGRLELYRETGETEHLESIESTTHRMMRLVDDLLEVARHGRVVEETGPTDVGPVLEAAREGTLPAGSECTYDPVPTLLADPDRLVQMFENLLRNAVEHGGADVTVRVGPLPDGFYVEDDGPGIPEADRQDVFERGYTTGAGGTGYGLAIVRSIVEAHGWDVSVTDAASGGARFEVTGVEFAAEA